MTKVCNNGHVTSDGARWLVNLVAYIVLSSMPLPSWFVLLMLNALFFMFIKEHQAKLLG